MRRLLLLFPILIFGLGEPGLAVRVGVGAEDLPPPRQVLEEVSGHRDAPSSDRPVPQQSGAPEPGLQQERELLAVGEERPAAVGAGPAAAESA